MAVVRRRANGERRATTCRFTDLPESSVQPGMSGHVDIAWRRPARLPAIQVNTTWWRHDMTLW